MKPQILCCLFAVTVPAFFLDHASELEHAPTTTAQNAPMAQLRSIGANLAKAVLERDVETILTYDRPDLRESDAVELRNQKSYLYCFLFDSTCTVDEAPVGS